MTDQQQLQWLNLWASQSYAWMNKARQIIEQNERLQKVLQTESQTKRMTADQLMRAFQDQYKKTQVAKAQLNTKNILIEGYTILNHIGEQIRNEEILYSVTITGDKKLISQSAKVYTLKIPESEFIKLLNLNVGSLKLKSPKTIFNKYKGQLEGEEDGLEYEIWSQVKQEAFSLFNNQVRIDKWRWSQINEGNVLEGFLRFTGNGVNIANVRWDKESNYWRSVYYTMQNTMKNPDAFYQGGDIGNEQIKGLYASITNIKTLINVFSDLLNIFRNFKGTRTTIEAHLKKSQVVQGIDSTIELSQQQVVEKLIQKFSSETDRNISIQL